MRIPFLKNDKGNAGLAIALSVIIMLFLIGVIVMLFVITGSEMMQTTTDVTAINVINETTQALGDVPDWFPLVIVITFVVVIVLLIALIVVAIKGTGFLQNGGGM